MADWSSLPPDLVRRVADRVLAGNDVDYYMGMRAVCHSWRLAVAPEQCHRHGATDLLCFRPRNWVMLDEDPEPDDDDGSGGAVRLFLDVCTGRSIRRRVPALRDHVLVAASDGLLVLADVKYPHAARVLSPLTGRLIPFAAAIPRVSRVRAAVTGSDDADPLLVFSFYLNPYGDAVSCARRTDGELSPVFPFPVEFPRPAGPLLFPRQPKMVAYRGHVYIIDLDGQIVKCVDKEPVRYCFVEQVATVPWRLGQDFLVASAGELLLVHLWRSRAVEVFRVDVERRALEPVRSIGRRALFLGHRCLSVDADKLPSVDGNCVYLVAGSGKGVWRYDLRDGRNTMIPDFRDRPLGVVQVLLNYCLFLTDVKGQLHSIYRASE